MGISRENAALYAERFAVNKLGRATIISKLGAGLRQDWEDIWQECLLAFLRDCHRAENAEAFFSGIVNHLTVRHVHGAALKRKRAGVMEEKHEPVYVAPEMEGDAMPASERLNEIVSRMPKLHVSHFREWQRRGFRCNTATQRNQASKLMKSLRIAAGCEGKRTRFAFMKAA